MTFDTVIIGGGPAGLTAACFSGGDTVVIDRLSAPARKLLATGGGRCNVTHETDAEGVIAAFGGQARFMSDALKGFPPSAIRGFLAQWGVPTCVDPDGCVFPVSQRAADVAGALERAARANGAEIRCGVRATRLVLEEAAGGATDGCRVCAVETSRGTVRARRVILAAGGRSYPSLGSDGSGFELARQAGVRVVEPVPALAGLFTREAWPATLAGLVLERGAMGLAFKGRSWQWLSGPVLFTHKGMSGLPALDLSGEIAARLAALRAQGEEEAAVAVRVSFDASRKAGDWLALFEGWRTAHGGRALHNLLAGEMPRALAQTLCGLAGAGALAVARARRETLRALAAACAELELNITGTEGWERAMVTRGGVALGELSPRTLACRRVHGLHCVGEVVDLDGRCGGYNLTWAFASGRLAGLAAETAPA